MHLLHSFIVRWLVEFGFWLHLVDFGCCILRLSLFYTPVYFGWLVYVLRLFFLHTFYVYVVTLVGYGCLVGYLVGYVWFGWLVVVVTFVCLLPAFLVVGCLQFVHSVRLDVTLRCGWLRIYVLRTFTLARLVAVLHTFPFPLRYVTFAVCLLVALRLRTLVGLRSVYVWLVVRLHGVRFTLHARTRGWLIFVVFTYPLWLFTLRSFTFLRLVHVRRLRTLQFTFTRTFTLSCVG